jgi:hypothetical protein
LIYHDGGAFDYSFEGVFIDRFKWLATGLQKGEVFVIETLIRESNGRPSPELAAQLLPATEAALNKLRADEARLRARILKTRGICFEAVAEVKQALACYEDVLTHDPKVGVKRKADSLRKVV